MKLSDIKPGQALVGTGMFADGRIRPEGQYIAESDHDGVFITSLDGQRVYLEADDEDEVRFLEPQEDEKTEKKKKAGRN